MSYDYSENILLLELSGHLLERELDWGTACAHNVQLSEKSEAQFMEIHSVQEYIDVIETLKRNYTYEESTCLNTLFPQQVHSPKFIFRGHGDHKNYKILPGIFRTHKPSRGIIATMYSQMEYNVLYDFISEACRYVKDVSVNNIPAWLEIAQHFGVPTRLLDFTENPLVALYFACSDLADTQASVWIVNEPAYNKIFFGESAIVSTEKSQCCISHIITNEIVQQNYQNHDGPYYIQYPWIYKPCYREERMNLQSSVFMLWGAKRQELTSFMEPKISCPMKMISKIKSMVSFVIS